MSAAAPQIPGVLAADLVRLLAGAADGSSWTVASLRAALLPDGTGTPADLLRALITAGVIRPDPTHGLAEENRQVVTRWLTQQLTPLAQRLAQHGRAVWWIQENTVAAAAESRLHCLIATTSDGRLLLAAYATTPTLAQRGAFLRELTGHSNGGALVAFTDELGPLFDAAATLEPEQRHRLWLVSPSRADRFEAPPAAAPAAAPAVQPAAAEAPPAAAKPPLYRAEAMQSQRRRLEGDVLLAQPLSHRLLTGGVVLLLVAFVLFASFGRFAKTTQAGGVLMPEQGVVKVAAPLGGIVSGLKVQVGDRVEAGQLLFAVSNPRVSSGGGEVDRQVLAELERSRAALEAELGNAQTQAALERMQLEQALATSRSLASRLGAELALEQERLALLGNKHERYVGLAGKGLVAPIQAQDLQEQLLSARARVLGLGREQDAAAARIREAQSALAEQPLRLKTRLGELEQRSADVRRQMHEASLRVGAEVAAPRSGRVAAVLVAEGARIGAEKPAILLMDDGAQLQAQLFVPTSGIAMLEPGQEVRLKLAAFPYQRFGYQKGRVVGISQTAVDPGAIDVPFRLQEAAYTVTVALDTQTIRAFGEARALTAGMQVDADIVTDQPRIIEWALEPLLSLRGNS